MQIALTKKLADAMKIKPSPADDEVDPLFKWTANWTNTWSNRKANDRLVMVNQANRFAVLVYEMKRKDLKDIEEIMINAIRNTLLASNIPSEDIEEYLRRAGKIEFVKNSDRKATSWVTRATQDSTNFIDARYNGMGPVFDDTIGADISQLIVNVTKKAEESFVPSQKMQKDLKELLK